MLKIKNLSIKYGDNYVLKNINLEFQPGTINVISGLSGSGKTTLIKTINGIIPEFEPATVEGNISFDNHNLLKETILNKTKYISMVFQNPKTQFYCINSNDEVAFGLQNRNISKQRILKTINSYTKKLQVSNLLNEDVFSLSGGEKQLLAITSVACLNNDIYLFDEPSASLDKEAIERLVNILKMLKKRQKIIIIVEHRLYYLKAILDSLTVIENKTNYSYDKKELEKDYLSIQEKHYLRTFNEIKYNDLKKKTITKVKLINNWDVQNKQQCDKKLHCKRIKKKYSNLILDLSIDFAPGVYFIIGKNGIGKSTFINCLCKLNNCKSLTYYNNRKIKRTYKYFALVMQDVNYQIFTESCYKELNIIQKDKEKIIKSLKDVGLIGKINDHPQSLSVGEKQRLMIAKAKVSEKPIIIFDEPTSGLDKLQMINMANYLRNFASDEKIIFVITHDYELISECKANIMEFTK